MACLHFRSAMVIVFAAAIGSGACGSTTFTSGGAGTGGTTAGGTGGSGGVSTGGTGGVNTGGTGGVNTGGTGGVGPVDCSKKPIVFPDFERACSGGAASCAKVTHQINCCGTKIVTGINHSEMNAYIKAETICTSQYPSCGCAVQPTRTDTGQIVTTVSVVKVKVACYNGTCRTYLMP